MTRPYRLVPADEVLACLSAERQSRIEARADELIASELAQQQASPVAATEATRENGSDTAAVLASADVDS